MKLEVNRPVMQLFYTMNIFLLGFYFCFQEREVARIRATIVWGMTTALEILKSSEENREQFCKQLSDVVKNFENVFENINSRDDLKPLVHNQLCLPLPSRLQSHLSVPYRDIIGSLFKVTMYIFFSILLFFVFLEYIMEATVKENVLCCFAHVTAR